MNIIAYMGQNVESHRAVLAKVNSFAVYCP